MKDKKVFNSTEARQKFFQLLRMAEEGHEPIIIKKDRGVAFKVSMIKTKKKEDIDDILKKFGDIQIKTMSPKKMKKIFSSRLDLDL